jgi:hypothetical protein
MKLFIDNVPNLVVRAIIASRLTSMFCPKSVFVMDPVMVAKIASESEDKKLLRQEINEKLKALEAGNTLCKQYAIRVSSGQLRSDPILHELLPNRCSPTTARCADGQTEKRVAKCEHK